MHRHLASVTGMVLLALLGASLSLVAQDRARDGQQGVKVIKDLEYARVGDNRLLLDLYLPANGEGPFPVLVAIHGGGWQAGKKEDAPGFRQASRGYAVASLSYRLSGAALFPAQIEDCKAAVRWLRANVSKYNLDPDRFGATGHSAGGHLASLLGTTGNVKEFEKGAHLELSSRVQCVCALSGPTDFLQMDAHALKDARLKHDHPASPESRLIGGPIQENKDKVTRANPITYVSKDSPPFLLIHGDQDPLVPAHQAQLLHDALKDKGIEATLHLVKGAGHGVGGPEVNNQIDRFFDTHLKKADPKKPVVQKKQFARAEWVDPTRGEPSGTKYQTFRSKTLDAEVSYLIYLPPDYDKQTQKYPVIYWLHGLGGNKRAGASMFVPHVDRAIREGALPPSIVVSVNGMVTSFYCDWANGKRPIESVIIKDLIPHMDATYRTIDRREGRVIQGYSMGGFGAAHLGFKYPEVFGMVIVDAGALVGERAFQGPNLRDIFQEAFAGDKERFLAEHPTQLVTKNAGKIRGKMAVRIGVGEKDELLPRNRELHELLDQMKIAHQYEVVPEVAHAANEYYRKLGNKGFELHQKVLAPLVKGY